MLNMSLLLSNELRPGQTEYLYNVHIPDSTFHGVFPSVYDASQLSGVGAIEMEIDDS